MSTIGVYEAKKHFSKLLGRAMSREEIVIARSEDPVVRLEAIGVLEQRRFGTGVGVVEVPKDFEAIAVPEVGRRASELSPRHSGVPVDAGPTAQVQCCTLGILRDGRHDLYLSAASA